MLSGCAPSVGPALRPNLPPAPATFGLPVPVPVPTKGEDARAFAAITRGALLNANQRLINDKAFYSDVLVRFSNLGMKK